ncbi:MAG: sarcosine oxidase subunit gamma [Rubellimicrobium sp.]|nr:sarcosine oxidase subunit gamma [Rubellimicrobium sp.]
MARLTERTACDGLVPRAIGLTLIDEAPPRPITAIAPLRGRAAEVDRILRAAHGVGFPAPNSQATGPGGVRILWAGHGRALLIGAAAPAELAGLAALSDQGDGLALVTISGADAGAVLARLVPVDLRAAAFGPGASLRTLVNHMAAQVSWLGPEAFEIMALRSMAGTLVHELTQAATAVAARRALA